MPTIILVNYCTMQEYFTTVPAEFHASGYSQPGGRTDSRFMPIVQFLKYRVSCTRTTTKKCRGDGRNGQPPTARFRVLP